MNDRIVVDAVAVRHLEGVCQLFPITNNYTRGETYAMERRKTKR